MNHASLLTSLARAAGHAAFLFAQEAVKKQITAANGIVADTNKTLAEKLKDVDFVRERVASTVSKARRMT